MTEWLSASDIAGAAGVSRAAVSNWRERNADFPEMIDGRFGVRDVARWLDARRIPRDARRADEPAETTYGDRFRATLGLPPASLAGTAVAAPGAVAEFRRLATGRLRSLRGADTRANYEQFVLGLLQARLTDEWEAITSEVHELPANELIRHVLDRLVSLDLYLSEPTYPVDVLELVSKLDQLQDRNSIAAAVDGLLEDFAAFQLTSEFHTPRSIVRTVINLLKPLAHEEIYDPCCGNGGFLVAAVDEVGATKIAGRALSSFSWRMANMRLSVRGIDADLAAEARYVLQHDEDRDRKFDVIMCNPPFAMRDWADQRFDSRWRYGTPPRGNANFAWIQHVLDKLASGGRAAIVMAPGASFARGVEAEIRSRMIEDRTVDAVIELPHRLFRATGIAVQLWLLRPPNESDDRVLLVSAQDAGREINRRPYELTEADINEIVAVHEEHHEGTDVLEPGFARSVAISEIREHDYQLQPGTYLSSPRARSRPVKWADALTEQRQRLSELTNTATDLAEVVARQLDRVALDRSDPLSGDPSSRTVPLGDVCDVLAGPSGMLRELAADEHGIPVLTPRNLRRNRVDSAGAELVHPVAREKLARYLLKADDVLCSRTGTIGRTALVTDKHSGALFGPGFLRLRPHGPKLSNRYLLQYLATEWVRDWMEKNCARTTVPSLSAKTMRRLPIWLPPLDQQEAINEVMGALDEQLELRDEIADATMRLKDHLGQLIDAGDFPLRY